MGLRHHSYRAVQMKEMRIVDGEVITRSLEFTDWSSLMSDLQRSLTRVEESLRLLHMDPLYIHKARGNLIVSRAILKQLEDWCEDKRRV